MSKLIKRTNGRYDLYYSDDINQLNTIASTQHELNVSKLSVKNCESIKNGYDLDELAKDYANGKSSSDVFKNAHEKDFITGFQKALEIIGDKKFSEYDIRKAYNTNHYSAEDKEENWSTFFKQLQPKEWDVEIVMIYGFDDINDPKPFSIPKLDSDGCLILKRK